MLVQERTEGPCKMRDHTPSPQHCCAASASAMVIPQACACCSCWRSSQAELLQLSRLGAEKTQVDPLWHPLVSMFVCELMCTHVHCGRSRFVASFCTGPKPVYCLHCTKNSSMHRSVFYDTVEHSVSLYGMCRSSTMRFTCSRRSSDVLCGYNSSVSQWSDAQGGA